MSEESGCSAANAGVAPPTPFTADFLHVILDNIHDEISIVDRDRWVIYVNQVFADHYGEAREKIIGRSCYDVFRQRDSECGGCVCVHTFAREQLAFTPVGPDAGGLNCHRARALVTGVPVEYGQWEETHEGRRCVDRRTFPIMDENGNVAFVLHCARDVTEQRRMEASLRRQREQLGRIIREVRHVRHRNDTLNAQLMQTEKLASLGEMASIMAHDLDSPLSVIMGYAEMLRSALQDEESRRRLHLISQQAERCHHIVRRLLDFARLPEPTIGPVILNDVLCQVTELLEHAIISRRVNVLYELPDDLPAVRGDSHALTQMCFNLFRNALDAVDHGGEIRLRTSATPGGAQVVFEIEDNGHGLPASKTTQIFEPFYTTKPPGEGTGLGLPICQNIARNHGGRILAENREEGGARFRVVLPVAGPERTQKTMPL